MSYANMDHADWVQRNIASSKQCGKPRKNRHGEPIGWHAAPDTLTDAQARAFNILGMTGGGIYNCPITWDSVEWLGGRGVAVTWHKSMATFDSMELTRFVFLCHVARVRGCISPSGPGLLRIMITERRASGSTMDRHPDLAEAITEFAKYLPANHSVIYSETTQPLAAEGGGK